MCSTSIKQNFSWQGIHNKRIYYHRMGVFAFLFSFLYAIDPASFLRLLQVSSLLTCAGRRWSSLRCGDWRLLLVCCGQHPTLIPRSLWVILHLVAHFSTPISLYTIKNTWPIVLFSVEYTGRSILPGHRLFPFFLRLNQPILLKVPASESSSVKLRLPFPQIYSSVFTLRFLQYSSNFNDPLVHILKTSKCLARYH